MLLAGPKNSSVRKKTMPQQPEAKAQKKKTMNEYNGILMNHLSRFFAE